MKEEFSQDKRRREYEMYSVVQETAEIMHPRFPNEYFPYDVYISHEDKKVTLSIDKPAEFRTDYDSHGNEVNVVTKQPETVAEREFSYAELDKVIIRAEKGRESNALFDYFVDIGKEMAGIEQAPPLPPQRLDMSVFDTPNFTPLLTEDENKFIANEREKELFSQSNRVSAEDFIKIAGTPLSESEKVMIAEHRINSLYEDDIIMENFGKNKVDLYARKDEADIIELTVEKDDIVFGSATGITALTLNRILTDISSGHAVVDKEGNLQCDFDAENGKYLEDLIADCEKTEKSEEIIKQ